MIYFVDILKFALQDQILDLLSEEEVWQSTSLPFNGAEFFTLITDHLEDPLNFGHVYTGSLEDLQESQKPFCIYLGESLIDIYASKIRDQFSGLWVTPQLKEIPFYLQHYDFFQEKFIVPEANLLNRNNHQVYRISPKELEVLEYLKEGMTNKEIAFHVGIAQRTVKFHITNLMKRTQAESRTELLFKLLKNRQIDFS